MAITFSQPVLLLMHGLPGAGKSAFARQFSDMLSSAHVNSDRLRYELYDDPKFTTSENNTVLRLGAYMTETLLKVGASVVFDMHLPTQRLRDNLKRLAEDYGAVLIIVWVQTDVETASWRASHRDRRRPDDKYSFNLSSRQFGELAKLVNKNFRTNERIIVVSGKHHFKAQAAGALRHFKEMELVSEQIFPSTALAGRVDYERRNTGRNRSF